jgi:hypothetical protein
MGSDRVLPFKKHSNDSPISINISIDPSKPMRNVLEALTLRVQRFQSGCRSNSSVKCFELCSSDEEDELKDSLHLIRERIYRKRMISRNVASAQSKRKSSDAEL